MFSCIIFYNSSKNTMQFASFPDKLEFLVNSKLPLVRGDSRGGERNTKTSSARLERANETRGNWGGEAREKGTARSFVTDAFEFPAASGTEISDWLIDNRKLSRRLDEY